jgi:catalase
MPEAEAATYHINPFDLTKVWPHGDYPLIDVGVLELNENPDNYFAHVEQAAFAPAHVIDGIGYSPDKMLQGRILSYPDAHRYRLGANYEQIPVNRCPFMVNNYQRDGQMRVDGNGGKTLTISPTALMILKPTNIIKNQPGINAQVGDWYDRNAEGENDHYTQPGNLYRLMSDESKKDLIKNIVHSMSGIDGPKKDEITNRQLCHWFRADISLGMAVAQGLQLDLSETMQHMPPFLCFLKEVAYRKY